MRLPVKRLTALCVSNSFTSEEIFKTSRWSENENKIRPLSFANQVNCEPNRISLYADQNVTPDEESRAKRSDFLAKNPDNLASNSPQDHVTIFYNFVSPRTSASV